MSAPHVLVIGGGIGGAAAAHAMLRRGLDVTVHERAHEIAEVGAGIGLGANGARLLERYGLGDAVAATATPFVTGRMSHPDGTPIADLGTDAGSAGDPFDGTVGMHRADLLDLLLNTLPAGVVHTGRHCVGVEQVHDGVRVHFADGSSAEGDVVVGADGIHSAVARHVVPPDDPEAVDPSFSGIVAYRGLVPVTDLPGWPDGLVGGWLGVRRTLLLYPVRSGALVNYVGLVSAGELAGESWTAPGDPDRLRAEFAGWDPRVQELLSGVEETYRWGLYDRAPLPRWTRDRVTLLGDAAHPMLPFMGQGANQAIEDGAALAVLLEGLDSADVPAALDAYATLRLPRTAEIQRGSHDNGARLVSSDDDPAIVADQQQRLRAGMASMSWVHGYDVEAEAQAHRALSVR